MIPISEIPERALPLFQVSVAFIVLSTVAVGVRFWSRTVAHRGNYGWDDWTCLMAWVLSVGLCTTGILMSLSGLGRHMDDLSDDEQVTLLKMMVGIYFLFDLGIGFPKLSALLFYSRVFHNLTKWMDFWLYLGYFLVLCWELYMLFLDTLYCHPFAKYWDTKQHVTPGTCLNEYATYVSTGVFDVVVDVYLLILPLPMLWSLQMRTARKILVTGAFILAYCALAASIGRFTSIIVLGEGASEDFSYNIPSVLVWVVLEPAVAIVSICTPSWFHFARRWMLGGISSLFTRQELSPVTNGGVDGLGGVTSVGGGTPAAGSNGPKSPAMRSSGKYNSSRRASRKAAKDKGQISHPYDNVSVDLPGDILMDGTRGSSTDDDLERQFSSSAPSSDFHHHHQRLHEQPSFMSTDPASTTDARSEGQPSEQRSHERFVHDVYM